MAENLIVDKVLDRIVSRVVAACKGGIVIELALHYLILDFH